MNIVEKSLKFRSDLPSLKRLAIKVGSAAITNPAGGVEGKNLTKICRDILELRKSGVEVILISSGAIQTGRALLKFDGPKSGVKYMQALSSVGQPGLMASYSKILEQDSVVCGQVLLTHEDFKNRTRYLNAKNTLEVLLHHQVLPILNENDSVSFEEIAFGDNDHLAVMVSEMLGVDALLVLTTPDGLYSGDPQDPQSYQIQRVAHGQSTAEVRLAKKSAVGKGGMESKLKSVRKLTGAGIPVVLATFHDPRPILRALTQPVGTFFEAGPKKTLKSKKSWLMSTTKSNSAIVIDEGASRAISKGASLLAVGIRKVVGTFQRGESIEVRVGKKVFCAGLTEYSSKEISKIKGLKVEQISEVLEFCPSNVVIHRNNMVFKE
jgi:glutamate 5-kinase